MAERRNSKWMFVGLVGTGVAILVGGTALLGIPNCSELVTETEAASEHATIRSEAQQMVKALRELTKAENERTRAEHNRFEKRFEQQEEHNATLRSRTWKILEELKK